MYWHRAQWEEDRYYQAALVEAPDRWLWDLLFAPEAKSYPIEVSALAPGASKLSVWLQGASVFPAEPDHHVRVYVNGSLVEELSWNGKQAKHVASSSRRVFFVKGTTLWTWRTWETPKRRTRW